jgi:hypothetical protein
MKEEEQETIYMREKRRAEKERVERNLQCYDSLSRFVMRTFQLEKDCASTLKAKLKDKLCLELYIIAGLHEYTYS